MSLYSYVNSILPHGSGVNGDYGFNVYIDRITVNNVWDNMNENGFYDGFFKFSITYPLDGSMILHFHGLTRNDYRKIADNDLRNYLEELYYNFVPVMVNILKNNIDVYENNVNTDELTPLERGFLETLTQDSIYNFMDDTEKDIPDYARDKLENYPFTLKNIHKKSLDYCLKVIREAGKGLPDNVDKYDLGGEIYLAICYGETENPIAKEIVKSSKWQRFADASKEISYDCNGKYMIIVE